MPDLVVASTATGMARQLTSAIDILVRASGQGEVAMLHADGALEVVQPEVEAGQELTRCVLRRMGLGRDPEMASSRRRTRSCEPVEDGDEVG